MKNNMDNNAIPISVKLDGSNRIPMKIPRHKIMSWIVSKLTASPLTIAYC
jgi:hypothetical protein